MSSLKSLVKGPFNTYKVCTPDGTERFDYVFPIAVFNYRIHDMMIDPLSIHNVITYNLPTPFIPGQLRFKGVTTGFVLDVYVDFTDYTLYNTKKISFHHLN